MSGGSFDYLFSKTPGGVVDAPELDDMFSQLDQLGPAAHGVAQATAEVLAAARSFETQIQALAQVWRAVEWWRSGDSGRDEVFVAIGEWQARKDGKP